MTDIEEQSDGAVTGTDVKENMLDDFVRFADVKPRSAQSYTCNLRQFFKYLSSNHITRPQRDDIVSYRAYLEKDHKPTTVQTYLETVKLFFKWTASSSLYPDIADHIKGEKIDTDHHKKDYLNPEQVKTVLQSIDRSTEKGARDYALILLMVTGGLRDIEVSRANINDVDTVGGNPVLFVAGKDRDGRYDYVKLPKKTLESLQNYIDKRKKHGMIDRNSPLFVGVSNAHKGDRLTPRGISGIVKGHLINAGFDSDRITAHSLRHTAVTLSLMAGLDIQEVRQFARHRSINTTMIYVHDLDRSENRAADAIADQIFKDVKSGDDIDKSKH